MYHVIRSEKQEKQVLYCMLYQNICKLLIFNTSFTKIKNLEIKRLIEFDCPIIFCEFDFVQ